MSVKRLTYPVGSGLDFPVGRDCSFLPTPLAASGGMKLLHLKNAHHEDGRTTFARKVNEHNVHDRLHHFFTY